MDAWNPRQVMTKIFNECSIIEKIYENKQSLLLMDYLKIHIVTMTKYMTRKSRLKTGAFSGRNKYHQERKRIRFKATQRLGIMLSSTLNTLNK